MNPSESQTGISLSDSVLYLSNNLSTMVPEVHLVNDGKAIIPTLNLNYEIRPIYKKLSDLNKRVDEINVLIPIIPILSIVEIRGLKKELEKEYQEALTRCYDLTIDPVESPVIMTGMLQSWSFARGMIAINKLQDQWRELGSNIDRKAAYSFSILSLYIAMLSIAISLLLRYM